MCIWGYRSILFHITIILTMSMIDLVIGQLTEFLVLLVITQSLHFPPNLTSDDP